MRISGAGAVAAGDYNEEIHISGSGHVTGSIQCTAFSGTGSTRCDGDVNAMEDIGTVGSFSAKGSLCAGGKCKVVGAASVDGRIKANALSAVGALKVGGDIESEEVDVRGALNCGGLINSEIVKIEFESRNHAGAIGGGKINIIRKKKTKISLHLFSWFSELVGGGDCFNVDETIEGDCIAIEGVKANTVTGKAVTIGAGCEIDTVRYSEKVEISSEAKVARIEKE